MKKTVIYLSLMAFAWAASCSVSEDEIVEPENYDCLLPFEDRSGLHPNHATYQALLDEIVYSGAPGIMMTVYDGQSPHGHWVGAGGKADLKNNVDMKKCNITRVGSTVKMFTAVTVLKLAEEGKLKLDDEASLYLSNKSISRIDNADRATVRQLLQHTSGIYNYIQNPHFQTASLNDLVKEWQPDELLGYTRGRDANFPPGSDADYSNTNYIFLGQIIETIEGKPFYEVFEEKIFGPLHLSMTSFAATDPVPGNIIRGYIDLYGKLQVSDATRYSGWDYYTADGGLISNPYDLVLFFKSVVDMDIVSRESFEEMTDWAVSSNDDETSYGLGIFKMKTKFGEIYIHSGDAIGYFASMIYLPWRDVHISWAVNGNYGKIDDFTQSREAIEHIIETVVF